MITCELGTLGTFEKREGAKRLSLSNACSTNIYKYLYLYMARSTTEYQIVR